MVSTNDTGRCAWVVDVTMSSVSRRKCISYVATSCLNNCCVKGRYFWRESYFWQKKEKKFYQLWSDLCERKQKTIKKKNFLLDGFYSQQFSVEILTDLIQTQKPSSQGMQLTARLHAVQNNEWTRPPLPLYAHKPCIRTTFFLTLG